jgi:hypothetical protein
MFGNLYSLKRKDMFEPVNKKRDLIT